jgi:hypothetical protein
MASELIERALYGGNIRIIHNPDAKGSAPRYKIVDGSGEILSKPKGVTTILGKTLAKDLMDWGISCCVAELEEKLPVITKADLEKAAKAYTRKRDSGASTGSEAHAMVEDFLKGIPARSGSQEARNAYNAFVQWFNDVTPTVINVEEVIYSHEYEYAGTYDCMLEIDGKVVLCDLKTTNTSRQAPNGIYADYFIQLGAYAAAHEEQRSFEETNGKTELRPIDDLMVISAKKNGKMDIATASDLGLSVAECGDMFKRVANLFAFQTQLTKALGGK